MTFSPFLDDGRNETILQFAQCILKHCAHVERDGLPNSKAHLEKIVEDARTIENICLDQEYTCNVHLG